MKILLDENLSPRLVERLRSLFSELVHVRDVGLNQASDRDIWHWAHLNGYAVITGDSDFVVLSQSRGWPPKIVHIERCDFPLRVIEALLRRNTVRIAELDKSTESGLLVIRLAENV